MIRERINKRNVWNAFLIAALSVGLITTFQTQRRVDHVETRLQPIERFIEGTKGVPGATIKGPQGSRGKPGKDGRDGQTRTRTIRIVTTQRLQPITVIQRGTRGAKGDRGDRGPRGPVGIGIPGRPGTTPSVDALVDQTVARVCARIPAC